jgi:pimeloyl-ACP methyl ester carboxylesterase
VVSLLVLCGASTAPVGAAGAEPGSAISGSSAATRCVPERFDVALAASDPTKAEIAGTLCTKPGNRILMITLHGATYNRMYWDWPQDPSTYSFVQNQRPGISVLNLDRLGAGESEHPPSVVVNATTQAYAVHQIVQAMRSRGFTTVVLVGHSLGCGIAVLEAATYHDVDGLILTGFLHTFAEGGRQVPMSLYPAVLDPLFTDQLFDPGYLTTRPGTRSMSSFYNTAIADPEVIAYDDAHKDVVTATDVAQFVSIVNNRSFAREVDVPVLSLQGQYDAGFCDPPDCPQAEREPDAWGPAAQLELHVIPDAGHNIHLHAATAQIEFDYIDGWLQRHFRKD